MKKIAIAITLLSTMLLAKVDINSASLEELTTIKGIGETKAKAIIEYRKANCFKSVDELANVKGLGEKSIAKIRDDISATGCKNQ